MTSDCGATTCPATGDGNGASAQYRLCIDPNATPASYCGYLAGWLVNSRMPGAVECVWMAPGSVPGGYRLESLGVEVATGSVPSAMALANAFATPLAVDADTRKWMARGGDALATSDYATLTRLATLLDETLRMQTFLAGVQLTLSDVFVWSGLRGSRVWGGLAKTPATTGHEVVRWYVHLTEHVFAEALNVFATEGRRLRERRADQGSFAIDLEGAEMGRVVTRFPPEPSGYLHIGHAKAVLLNQYFARIYQGEMIVRFDDTNPSKEKDEYETAILEDLQLLGVTPQRLTHTSDYFPQLEQFCAQMLQEGTAYADNTPQEQMRAERMDGIESRCRNQTPEENLRWWGEMQQGTPEGMTYCIRAKISMSCLNKALRDPVMYRCNVAVPHHRTGTTHRVYPTYDFACPIVDSLEGVTHALRTNEYHDRNDQYAWFLTALRLRRVSIWDYSRLNFVYTLLSKRKLTWFVDGGRVSGWDDPRFPTVRGIRRRGLTIDALREYILMQGASKNTLMLEWDKLWAVNRRIVDPIAPRYTALVSDRLCRVSIDAGEGRPATPELRVLPRHRKNPALGTKSVAFSTLLFMEQADVNGLRPGDEFTLVDWGNVIVRAMERVDATTVASMSVELNLAGSVRTTTLKATWLSPDPAPLLPLLLHDYDYLITKRKLEEEDRLEDCLTPVSEFITPALGDPSLATALSRGDIIQFERKGFFILDELPTAEQLAQGRPLKFIAIPDGNARSIASKHS